MSAHSTIEAECTKTSLSLLLAQDSIDPVNISRFFIQKIAKIFKKRQYLWLIWTKQSVTVKLIVCSKVKAHVNSKKMILFTDVEK